MTETLHILVAGLNHRTAPVALRERVAFGAGDIEDALFQASMLPGVREVVIVSTCNRAELYAASNAPDEAGPALSAFFASYHDVPADELRHHLYELTEQDATQHIFRVAVGLDSMVLGEGQVLAQVKQALLTASGAGTARACLQELFQRALNLGKRARTETGIARGAMSISSAAVDLARSTFGELAGREVLVVGAGKMSRQTLTHLAGCGVRSVIVANRTFDRAAALAADFGGQAIRFDDFPRHLEQADIVVSSSAAPHPIITPEVLRPCLPARRGRPLVIVDIAVPRDVDPAVAEFDDVYLFDIDDLQGVCERYRAEREREAIAVTAMVAEETERFAGWLQARAMAPLLTELRTHAETLCEHELERYLRRMPDLRPDQRELIGQMMRGYAHKLMHEPTTRLRAAANYDEGPQWAAMVRGLFGLRRPAPPEPREEPS